jgi:hypothetical protein
LKPKSSRFIRGGSLNSYPNTMVFRRSNSMKKNIVKALYIVSVLLAVACMVLICVDWIRYDPIQNSAPFYVFAMVRCIEFLPLSAIALIVALVLRKVNKGDK